MKTSVTHTHAHVYGLLLEACGLAVCVCACLFAFGCVRARHLNKPILSRKHFFVAAAKNQLSAMHCCVRVCVCVRALL